MEWNLARQLRNREQLTDGTVLNSGRQAVGAAIRCFVTYQYSVKAASGDPQTYSRTQTISEKHWIELQNRKTVTVGYLPGNPAVSRLAGPDIDHTRRRNGQFFVVLGVCGVALAVLLSRVF
jgi:hypothetical protein